MENVSVGLTVLGLILGSLILLAAILKSGKAKHNQKQNKKNSTLYHV